MNVLVFGSYDLERHPRARVLIEGLRAHGESVSECNVPLGVDTAQRLEVMRGPWRAPAFGLRIATAWRELYKKAKFIDRPDVILVPYMGHFDIHLARHLWPEVPIALDHLISAAATARDRRIRPRAMLSGLRVIDRASLSAADIPFVDTEEHRRALVDGYGIEPIVVPVGAPEAWFRPPERRSAERLRVVFFGLYTPLQGTEVIARAAARLCDEPIDFLMVGTGQDYESARHLAGDRPNIRWLNWLDGGSLLAEVARHDVCLGIFGGTPKAKRVVPNKVYQGAAAGCAVITSDTAPQRRALLDCGVYVSPGDDVGLARAIAELERDRTRLWALKERTYRHARVRFWPEAVSKPLWQALERGISSGSALSK